MEKEIPHKQESSDSSSSVGRRKRASSSESSIDSERVGSINSEEEREIDRIM